MSRARIGIYSGTFDPVHRGHLALAQAAMTHAELSALYFMLESRPRDKHSVTDLRHRRHMVELALEPFEDFSLLESPDEQFTVTGTLPWLKQHFAGSEICLILGSDVFLKMSDHRWPGIEELIKSCHLVVGLRQPNEAASVHDAADILAKKTGLAPQYQLVIGGLPKLSSTEIRTALHAKQEPVGLKPAVKAYIASRQLYRA